jgi:putative SOS response-associated peptidase YedK
MNAEKEEYFREYEFQYEEGERYNIAPSEYVAAVRNTGENVVEPIRWGLVPSWAKEIRIGYKMINARYETLADKPAYRSAIKRRRCLILADGFYEWKHPTGSKAKIPFYIRLKNKNPFALAGLWEKWMASEKDEPLRTCTVITTESNDVVGKIHPRMPVILNRDDYNFWLDPTEHKADDFKELFKPYSSDELDAYQVSSKVNKAGFDSPDLINPVRNLDSFAST